MTKVLIWILSLWLPLAAQAVVVEFPEEELAKESVLPVFERKVAVRSRNILTQNRVEIGGGAAYSLVEPFANPYSLAISASYHFNEIHGLNLMVNSFLSGNSKYAEQLQNPAVGGPLNLHLAPAPQTLAMLNYQFTAYYGKMSLAKDTVINQSLYGLLGLGALAMGGESLVVLSGGLGQKFYITPRWALRFDLRLMVYQGPDVVSKPLKDETTSKPPSFFRQTMVFSSLLNVGIVFLI